MSRLAMAAAVQAACRAFSVKSVPQRMRRGSDAVSSLVFIVFIFRLSSSCECLRSRPTLGTVLNCGGGLLRHEHGLIHGDDPCLKASGVVSEASIGADCGEVLGGVEAQAEPLQALANARADGRAVLSGAAAEDDGLCAAQRGQERAHVFAHPVAKHLHGQRRASII